MHDTAYEHGRLFFELYGGKSFRTVVELGSQDVNGSLKDHCPPGAHYIGLDMIAAYGVDVVVGAGEVLPIASECVDAVVTSSVFEHDVCFWDTFLELMRILRPGGLLYVNVPSNDAFHRYPLDCWRFYPDAGVALVRLAARRGVQIELVESFIGLPQAERWADFVAVFLKEGGSGLTRRGSIAEHSQAINIYDRGMPIGGPLTAETENMPDMAIAADLRIRLAAIESEAAVHKADLFACRSDLAIREADVAALEADRAERQVEQAAREADLIALRERNVTLTADVSASRVETAALRGTLHQADQRIEKLEAALTDVTRVAEAMRASTSWRLTAGLRRLVTVARGRNGPAGPA